MLDLDPMLMAVIAVVFLGVVARLNSCLYQPLMKHMDDRENMIKKRAAQCEQNSGDLQKYYDEANHILSEAKREAASITQSAISEATAMGEAKLNEFRISLEEKLNNELKLLEEDKVLVTNKIKSEIDNYRDLLVEKFKNV